MARDRSQAYDPRTIARELGGVFEVVFPQLVPGIVSHFNRTYLLTTKDCTPIPKEALDESSLQPAMLFELAIVVTEWSLRSTERIDWNVCLERACSRQQRYFDAKLPAALTAIDQDLALAVATNLNKMLKEISKSDQQAIVIEPRIPGYQWIGSGVADFGTATSIIEVKCTNKHFSTADYRQIVIYWLLAYIERLEKDSSCWTRGILLNPRLCFAVAFDLVELIPLMAVRRSLVEIVESFRTMFDDSWLDEDISVREGKEGAG